MGEDHPASKKVVVEFCPEDLPNLTDTQRTKLVKLVGPRYNPSTSTVRMSCESFETQAQNKRYLGDLIAKLLKTAKDEKSDSFKDIPVDFRHHTPKPFHIFPERWKLTPERRKVLEEKRVKALEEEEKRKSEGKLVDGVGVIDEAMKRLGMREMLEARQRETAAVGAKRGAPGRGRLGQGTPKRF
jgi:small subunit ribosomal protein S35